MRRGAKPTRGRLLAKARRIRFLLLDVDGVMTDGTIYLDDTGREFKGFHIHDGYGIHRLQKSGVPVGIITGRESDVVTRRARELGITEVWQNVSDKLEAYEAMRERHGLSDAEVAYVGDDLIDLPVLERVGLAVAVADAVPGLRSRVDWITRNAGGRGAVREVTDLIMDARGTN